MTPAPRVNGLTGKGRVKCPKSGYRLFDLSTNPEELEPPVVPDAATNNPLVFDLMKLKLEEFVKSEAPVPTYVSLDKNGPGRPRNNNGVSVSATVIITSRSPKTGRPRLRQIDDDVRLNVLRCRAHILGTNT